MDVWLTNHFFFSFFTEADDDFFPLLGILPAQTQQARRCVCCRAFCTSSGHARLFSVAVSIIVTRANLAYSRALCRLASNRKGIRNQQKAKKRTAQVRVKRNSLQHLWLVVYWRGNRLRVTRAEQLKYGWALLQLVVQTVPRSFGLYSESKKKKRISGKRRKDGLA